MVCTILSRDMTSTATCASFRGCVYFRLILTHDGIPKYTTLTYYVCVTWHIMEHYVITYKYFFKFLIDNSLIQNLNRNIFQHLFLHFIIFYNLCTILIFFIFFNKQVKIQTKKIDYTWCVIGIACRHIKGSWLYEVTKCDVSWTQYIFPYLKKDYFVSYHMKIHVMLWYVMYL